MAAQDVEMRLAGGQTDGLGEVIEGRGEGFGPEELELAAVLKCLPEFRVQADGLAEEMNRLLSLPFEGKLERSVQKGGVIGDGRKTPSAEDAEVGSENQAEAGYFEAFLEAPGAHEETAGYGQSCEKDG